MDNAVSTALRDTPTRDLGGAASTEAFTERVLQALSQTGMLSFEY